MKYLPLLVLLSLFSCAAPQSDCCGSGCTGDSGCADGPAWTSLFDGESFEHWRGYGQTAMPAGWIIDDGAMYAKDSGEGMDLVTRETYTNFELELEWRVHAGGNSGIMWHVDESAGAYPWMTGPEFQILDDAAYDGGKIGKNSAGSSYDVYAPAAHACHPAGQWNKVRIVVSGPHVQHFLNGVKVVEYTKGSDEWNRKVADSKWTKWPAYGTTSTGHIALQGDHGSVWFRQLRVRETPAPALR